MFEVSAYANILSIVVQNGRQYKNTGTHFQKFAILRTLVSLQ